MMTHTHTQAPRSRAVAVALPAYGLRDRLALLLAAFARLATGLRR